jgi:CRP-like cAMP-binding protein
MAAVPDADRMRALVGATVIEVAPGDVLLRQGTTSAHAFFVLSGRVVVKKQEGNLARITRTARPGDQFGEVSALHHTAREATAIAEEPSLILRLPDEALKVLMETREMHQVIHQRMSERLMITDRSLLVLRGIVQVSMIINVFLLVCEVFKEFYSGTTHSASAKYLFVGLHEHYALVPWIWTAIVFNLTSMVLLVLPLSRSLKWLDVACVLAIVGIWIEKGMGLVIPGFIPTPLGAIVDYLPSLNETLVCLGIWAFGLLCYTIFLRMSVPILQGRMTKANEGQSDASGEEADAPLAQPVTR